MKWLAAERIPQELLLLEITDFPIERMAIEVGFGTAFSLRQLFASQLQTSPSAYQKLFCIARQNVLEVAYEA